MGDCVVTSNIRAVFRSTREDSGMGDLGNPASISLLTAGHIFSDHTSSVPANTPLQTHIMILRGMLDNNPILSGEAAFSFFFFMPPVALKHVAGTPIQTGCTHAHICPRGPFPRELHDAIKHQTEEQIQYSGRCRPAYMDYKGDERRGTATGDKSA